MKAAYFRVGYSVSRTHSGLTQHAELTQNAQKMRQKNLTTMSESLNLKGLGHEMDLNLVDMLLETRPWKCRCRYLNFSDAPIPEKSFIFLAAIAKTTPLDDVSCVYLVTNLSFLLVSTTGL